MTGAATIAGAMVAALLVFGAGCGRKGSGSGGPAPAAATADPAKAAPPDPAEAGTVAGTVAWKGEVRLRPTDVAGTECEQACGAAEIADESLRVGAGGELAGAIVWLEGLDPKVRWPVPESPVDLDQKGCVYVPHVVTLRAGQPLRIRNSDGFAHNVHAGPRLNAEFNVTQLQGQQHLLTPSSEPPGFTLAEPAPFRIWCDIHGWMRAWVGVFEHPFHAVTGADGRFELRGVPPGKYVLKAWHERERIPRSVEVEVPARGRAERAFVFGE